MDRFFVDKPTKGDWKGHFYDAVCILINYSLFKSQKYGEGMVKTEINAIFGLTTLKHPYPYQLSLHYMRKKSLAPEKHCTPIVSVMWPESFELVFTPSLFHCSQQARLVKVLKVWPTNEMEGVFHWANYSCCCDSDFSECDLTSTLVGQQSSTNHPQLGDTTPLAI